MKTRRHLMFLVAASVACASCASAPASTATTRPATVRRDRSLITMEELAEPSLSALSVYEVIRVLRPNFLSNRGTQTITYEGNEGTVDPESGKVHASIDGSGIVSVEELKRLPVTGIMEIRLLDIAAAMMRYGATAKQGAVIVVRTR